MQFILHCDNLDICNNNVYFSLITFSGHGGAEAATFAKEHLINMIVNQKAFWSDDDREVLRAIREGYINTHYQMWKEQGMNVSFKKQKQTREKVNVFQV